MTSSKSIVVVAQNVGEGLAPAVLEAVAAARKYADEAGGKVDAVITGPPGTQDLSESLWKMGVVDVYVAEHDTLADEKAAPHALAAATAVEQADPSLIVVGQTQLGRDVAPYLAAKLDGGVIMNATDLRQGSGGAEVVCSIYGGAVEAVYRVSESPPSVVGVEPTGRKGDEVTTDGRGRVVSVDPGLDGFRDRVKVVERSVRSGPRLEEADVIVSGGMGLGDRQNYRYIEELAEALGGLPSASRAIVDHGWTGKSEWVGLSGTKVTPDLYVAVGISGASQHLAGMSTSRVIVAVNTDPQAPIFRYARYGVTLDCLEFLPSFIEECRKVKSAS